MTELAIIGPKIGKLVRLLGSDRDGEVLGAARGLRRTLKTLGFDLNDLGDMLEGGLSREPRAERVSEPGSWGELVEACLARQWGLNERELDFLRDVRGKFVLGAEPTAKQADWLRAIFAKTRRR